MSTNDGSNQFSDQSPSDLQHDNLESTEHIAAHIPRRRYFEQVQQNIPRGVLFVARLYPEDPAQLPPDQDSRLVGVVALALEEDIRQPVSACVCQLENRCKWNLFRENRGDGVSFGRRHTTAGACVRRG